MLLVSFLFILWTIEGGSAVVDGGLLSSFAYDCSAEVGPAVQVHEPGTLGSTSYERLSDMRGGSPYTLSMSEDVMGQIQRIPQEKNLIFPVVVEAAGFNDS